MRKVVDNIAYALDNLKVSRRAGFFFTLWVTYFAITTCASIAIGAGGVSFDVAAVIAAIMAPVTGLQAAIVKFHHGGHKDKSND